MPGHSASILPAPVASSSTKDVVRVLMPSVTYFRKFLEVIVCKKDARAAFERTHPHFCDITASSATIRIDAEGRPAFQHECALRTQVAPSAIEISENG